MTDAETLRERLESLKGSVDAEALEDLCAEIYRLDMGARFVPDLVAILEANPHFDFGVPSSIVHTIETFRGQYEDCLLNSLRRRPTEHTVWMLNRIINADREGEAAICLDLMIAIVLDEAVDADVRDRAKDFLQHQFGGPWAEIEVALRDE